MDLIDSVDLNEYAYVLDQNLTSQVPVKIWANGDTGEVRVYDPTDLSYYYYFYLPTKGLRGNWISLRTNDLKLSFGEGN
jgi:hypothetical protein